MSYQISRSAGNPNHPYTSLNDGVFLSTHCNCSQKNIYKIENKSRHYDIVEKISELLNSIVNETCSGCNSFIKDKTVNTSVILKDINFVFSSKTNELNEKGEIYHVKIPTINANLNGVLELSCDNSFRYFVIERGL